MSLELVCDTTDRSYFGSPRSERLARFVVKARSTGTSGRECAEVGVRRVRDSRTDSWLKSMVVVDGVATLGGG